MVSRRWVVLSGLFAAGAGTGYYFWPKKESHAPETSLRPVKRPFRDLQYIVINAQTGEILVEQNSNQQRQPASLTKLMTLALVFDAMANTETDFKLSSKVTIPHYIKNVRGDIAAFNGKKGKNGHTGNGLLPDEQYIARDLLIGAGSRSDAYSTLALALHLGSPQVYDWGGTEEEKAEKFLALMNQKAQEIGMANSHFAVMTGSPNQDNLSTPNDIAVLMQYIKSNHSNRAEISLGQASFDISAISEKATTHTSGLLKAQPDEIEIAKTGQTNAARYCLAVSSQRLIGVVFGANSRSHRNQIMAQILDQAEQNLNATFTPSPNP